LNATTTIAYGMEGIARTCNGEQQQPHIGPIATVAGQQQKKKGNDREKRNTKRMKSECTHTTISVKINVE